MEPERHPGNIERLIINTVTMLCKNSISYSSELRIQGTLGITVDASDIILIQMNERFEHDSEGGHRNVQAARDGKAAAEQSYAAAASDAKRPRISSVVQRSRMSVVRGRGRVLAPPVRRMRYGGALHAATGSTQWSRQQLAYPHRHKMSFPKIPHTPVKHESVPVCTSPQFPAGRIAVSNIPAIEAAQSCHKLEVTEECMPAVETRAIPLSSDVICVESDDETESVAKASVSMSSSVGTKFEGRLHDALQAIVNKAVVAARASNPDMV